MTREEELFRQGKTNYFLEELDTIGANIRDWRNRKGFTTDESNIPEKLMLIVTEVAEAMEELRDGAPEIECRLDGTGKPCGFASELADVAIRLLDLSASLGISMAREIAIKMAYNEMRPAKHGRLK